MKTCSINGCSGTFIARGMCRKHYDQWWWSKEPDKARAKWLKRSYGISVDEYESMLTEQGGVCASCGRSPGKRRLSVDHDHSTGQVRGLLCQQCNTALGMLEENPERFEQLLSYINTFKLRKTTT